MDVPKLPDDILNKILLELKYIEKQKYYDKCKKWLIDDISKLEDIFYWIECEKSFKNINDGYGKQCEYEKFDEVIYELNTIFSF